MTEKIDCHLWSKNAIEKNDIGKMQHVMWTYFWENMVPTVTTTGLSHNYRKLLQPIFWDLAIAARGLLGMVRKNVTQNQGPIGDLQFRWKSKTIKLGPLRLLIFNPYYPPEN